MNNIKFSTQAFADDKEIIAMSELRQSLEKNDLAKFERTLKAKVYIYIVLE